MYGSMDLWSLFGGQERKELKVKDKSKMRSKSAMSEDYKKAKARKKRK